MKPILKSLFLKPAVVMGIILCIAVNSCGPKVYSIEAKPFNTIGAKDTVFFDWKARGKTTLMVFESPPTENDPYGAHYIAFKLVAQKGNKETFKLLALTLLPDSSFGKLVINIDDKKGDSLIAAEVVPDSDLDPHFIIAGVTADTGTKRALTVIHHNKKIELQGSGGISSGLNGLPYSGPWEIRTRLTPNEERDSSTIPNQLCLKVIFHRKAN